MNLSQQGKKYRQEIKLLLTWADYLVTRGRLRALLMSDEHAGPIGDYWIRSLYLDDVKASAYWEKITGASDRKKYRIRIYDGSDAVIKLECKEKHGSCIRKRSTSISRDTYESLIQGDYSVLAQYEDPLCHEVLSMANRNGLSPSVVVDYDREAYVYPVSNVRLTFDKNLHAAVESSDIFDLDMMSLPVFPDQSVILEVKYDEFLPRYLADIVSNTRGTKIALSKFCLCRDCLRAVKPQYCFETKGIEPCKQLKVF